VRLPRYDFGQHPLNSIYFFTNHSNRLEIARIWHWCDCLYRVTNLVVAISNQIDSRGGFQSILVNPSSQFRGYPSEREPEQHLDWKTISCSIEVEERKPVYGLAKT